MLVCRALSLDQPKRLNASLMRKEARRGSGNKGPNNMKGELQGLHIVNIGDRDRDDEKDVFHKGMSSHKYIEVP